ncbi:FAD binding domain-containing protein [Nonomuraea soli]|uniref:Carbon-monoxide dehydrogenase medium subunit n=1 Tax=Nonomuraea soli TaxID=1032476 RepID=A0A7W0CNV4_9ACTN|nr:FAD binding domain-containing protein [Nonomuraea soli]MBA2894601.1 carbon-monoxide dehydrogenase medium subunit [Nonomuraea soli]
MKPPPFTYHAPLDLGSALDALAGAGARGKVLAGGQSLIPLMNMRLASPSHVIDINRVPGLDTIEDERGGVRVGALARHSRVERSGPAPLRRALKLVAHPVIRNRGTVVGSLVHADPAAELPAVLAVLGGSVRLASLGGVRDVAAADFFVGPLESDLRAGELAVSAFFPGLPPRSGFAIHELARRHGDYALAGVCAVVTLGDDGRIAAARAACIGVAATPQLVELEGGTPAELARAVQERTDPEGDIHASAAYRRHLVGVLAERAFTDAAREAAQ